MRGFVALAAACALGCGSPAPQGVAIAWTGGEQARFLATGLRSDELARASSQEAARVFSVSVKGADVPLLGTYRVEGAALVFEPRFPLKPGLEYRAVCGDVERTFSLPAPPSTPRTVVRHVYPSRGTLPENLLKFYVHFSAPMARGEAYRRARLVTSDGRAVDMPFLELGEELWDRSGTRVTLFIDPGRIKRGLKPREEGGPVFEEGKSYTLVLDREWQDAEGRPLTQAYRKSFTVGAPDEKQPEVATWKLQAPRAGTRDALTVTFPEPLDSAMLNRSLAVMNQAKKSVGGRIEIDQEETRWRFHPESAWVAGPHVLQVDTILEDLAGNSIGRPFEVDEVRPIERRVGTGAVALPFEIKE